MGDIIRPGSVPMRLSAKVIGTAPVERLDVLHGRKVVQTARPFQASDLGRRVRLLWQGAEYRGRGREVIWQGQLRLTDNRFNRFAQVNFLNPERKVQVVTPEVALSWTSVTTGNLAGIDLWLDQAQRGSMKIETNVVSGEIDLAALSDNTVISRVPNVGVALQTIPTSMSGDCSDLGNCSAHFEQSGNAFVTQIVEVQIFDLEQLAGSRKSGADRICREWKDLIGYVRHRFNNLHGLRRQLAEHVIAFFVSRIFHIANPDPARLLVEIRPGNAGDLFLASG